jgi:hypothetical protein
MRTVLRWSKDGKFEENHQSNKWIEPYLNPLSYLAGKSGKENQGHAHGSNTQQATNRMIWPIQMVNRSGEFANEPNQPRRMGISNDLQFSQVRNGQTHMYYNVLGI